MIHLKHTRKVINVFGQRSKTETHMHAATAGIEIVKMGTANAVAAAMVARRHREAQQAAAAANAKRSAEALEAHRKNMRSEGEARKAVMDSERRMRRQLEAADRSWFDRYDIDRRDLLSREQLRNLLTDLRPEEPPTDGAIDLLLTMCGEGATEVPRSMLREVTGRYIAYLDEKAALEHFFHALDTDNSGCIEQVELERVLHDLGQKLYPPYTPVEADLAFLYSACGVEFGTPITPGPPMVLLRPALSEWKRMIEKRQYEEKRERYRSRKASSAACVVL